jgi:aspartyl-tRNA(Asn)/glutamyl-tRNA(Gln) amidotransferase subunit A
MAHLADKTCVEALRMLAGGECSSVELTQAVLDRVETRDDRIQGYLHVDAQHALDQAEQADQKRASGQSSTLLGLPIAVKDLLNVQGQPCTCASRVLEGYTSPYDATTIARLRAEGAVFLGRVNMDEFAMGSTTENSAFKVTRNPWNTEHVPGGSSGGSAAVVSANEAFAALGSDTGGSIRQPASYCGCVGLKPSYGRVSRYGLTAFASSLDQVGPLTKDVADAALLMEVLAGQDPMDSTTLAEEVPSYSTIMQKGIEGLRLGIPREYFQGEMDPQVRNAVMKVVDALSAEGAQVIEISLPHTDYAIAAYYVLATAEASTNLARFDGIRYGARMEGSDPIELYRNTRAAGFGPEVKRRILLGTFVLSSGYHDAYYVNAQRVRTLVCRDFSEAFKTCDVLVAPVTPHPAEKVGASTEDPMRMYLNDVLTVPANLAGICGLSLPCGSTHDGLPIGVQVLGPSLGEADILRAAYSIEQLVSWDRMGIPLKD